MHQGSHSSNCEVVQKGLKLLRLDCAAGWKREKRQNGIEGERRDKETDRSGMTEGGGAGTESRTEGRKHRARVAPFWCQHISSHCVFFFPPYFKCALPDTVCCPDEALGHEFGRDIRPLHTPICQACDTDFAKIATVLFCWFMLFEQARAMTSTLECSTALIFRYCKGQQNNRMIMRKVWT